MMNQNKALTSVVSYPERGHGGNNRYRGNCSPKLIEDLITHFRPHEVCDYMCGSNTTADAARANRRGAPPAVQGARFYRKP